MRVGGMASEGRVASGGGEWLVGVVPFMVSNWLGSSGHIKLWVLGLRSPSHYFWSIWVHMLGLG